MEVGSLQIRSVDYNFTPVKPYAKPSWNCCSKSGAHC